MKSHKSEKHNSRREFVKNAAVGVAGAAVMGSLACSESPAPATDKSKTESSVRAMTREQFLEYIDYFNKKDFESVAGYFSPDVTLDYPDNFMGSLPSGATARTLHGPEEFIKNYKALTENVREVINVGVFLSEGSHFCVELITEFHALKTTATGAAGGQRKMGDISVLNQCVIYDLDEKGKFKRIRIFHHRHLDPAILKNKQTA